MACRLNRLIRIIRLVRTRAFPTVDDMCSKFQIKERTLFNDLRELREDLGVDIQFDKVRRGYYIASDITELNFITLNEESAFLLAAAIRLLISHGGEKLAAPLKASFHDELQFCLESDLRENKDAFREIFEAETIEQLDKNQFVELCKACLKQQPLRVHLEKDNKSKELVPSSLVYTADGWNLRYINLNDGTEPKMLALAKIKALETLSTENP